MIGEISQVISPLTGDFGDPAFTNNLLKRNLTHGTAETHDFGQHATASEAVFAPVPGAAEDAATSPTRTTLTAARLTWSSSPTRTSPPSPSRVCTCQPGSRSGFTAADSPTRITGRDR